MPDPDGPTAEELRDRYRDEVQPADLQAVCRLLGRDDIGPLDAWANRYATLEAFEAFADGNRRHHGHETLGPVPSEDGAFYSLTVFAAGAADAVLLSQCRADTFTNHVSSWSARLTHLPTGITVTADGSGTIDARRRALAELRARLRASSSGMH